MKTKTKIKIGVGLTAAFTLVAGAGYLTANYTYSDGTRSGVQSKISNKGFVFKTNEGNLASYDGPFAYSVADPAVAKKLESLEGKTVTIHYNQKLFSLPWRGDSAYIAVGAEENVGGAIMSPSSPGFRR